VLQVPPPLSIESRLVAASARIAAGWSVAKLGTLPLIYAILNPRRGRVNRRVECGQASSGTPEIEAAGGA